MVDASRVIEVVDVAFGPCPKPEVFCDPNHCEECAEHNALLTSKDRESLQLGDVGNPGWDPFCFSSPEGMSYYFPTLARFAVSPPTYGYGWYAEQLLFHLYSGHIYNAFYSFCDPVQRRAVAGLLAHLIESYPSGQTASQTEDELVRAHSMWHES